MRESPEASPRRSHGCAPHRCYVATLPFALEAQAKEERRRRSVLAGAGGAHNRNQAAAEKPTFPENTFAHLNISDAPTPRERLAASPSSPCSESMLLRSRHRRFEKGRRVRLTNTEAIPTCFVRFRVQELSREATGRRERAGDGWSVQLPLVGGLLILGGKRSSWGLPRQSELKLRASHALQASRRGSVACRSRAWRRHWSGCV